MILFGRLRKRKPKKPTIDLDELIRLRRVEELAEKMVKLLDDGQVDYELAEQLKGLLRG